MFFCAHHCHHELERLQHEVLSCFPSPNFYAAASEEQMLKWLEPQLMHKFCFLMAEPAIKKVKLATADGTGTGTQKADNRASISNAQGAVQPTETDSWPHKHRPQSTNDIIGNQSIVPSLTLQPNKRRTTVLSWGCFFYSMNCSLIDHYNTQ
jgi:hypothetical protein